MKMTMNRTIATALFASTSMGFVPSALATTFSFDGNLVEHHTFDVDVSDALGRSATAVGGASIASEAAVGAGALELDGSSGFVDLGSKASLNGLTTSTISTWIKADTNGTFNAIYATDGWTDPGGAQLHFNLVNQTAAGAAPPAIQAASPAFGGVVANWQEASVPTAPTEWIHTAFVNNNGDVALYVNGVLADSETAALITPIAFGDDAEIGAWGTSRYFDGKIDDLRIYDIALTEQQVAELAVPEPASLALLALGGLFVARRRR